MKQAQEKHRLVFSTAALVVMANALDSYNHGNEPEALAANVLIKKKLLEINMGTVVPTYVTKEKFTISDKLGFTDDDPIAPISASSIQSAKEKRKIYWDKLSAGKQCSREEYVEGMTYGMDNKLLTTEQRDRFISELQKEVVIGAEELERQWSL